MTDEDFGAAEIYCDDEEDRLLGPEDQCPGCGNYYSLSIGPPTMLLAAYVSEEELDAWLEEHNYNVSQCTVCGWSSEDDG